MGTCAPTAAVSRHRRLRRHRRPAAGERDPVAPRLHAAGPARPGQDPAAPHAAGVARRVAPDRRRLRDPRRSLPPFRRRRRGLRRGRRHADRVAASRGALRGETRHAGCDHRRYDRRHRSDQGRAHGRDLASALCTSASCRGRIAASSRSTSCRTSPARSRSGCSTSWRSGTSRSAAFRSGCRSICAGLHRQPRGLHRRGRIITPLKDRIGAEIRTHYTQPRRRDRDHRAGSLDRRGDPSKRLGSFARSSRRWRYSRGEDKNRSPLGGDSAAAD